MDKKVKLILGAAIGFVLAGLYGVTIAHMIIDVVKAGRIDPNAPIGFSAEVLTVATTVGGLVSALVIATLGITQPNNPPATYKVLRIDESTGKVLTNVLIGLFMTVWLIAGVAALVVGVLCFPKVNQTVHDLGMAWIGLAVAALYAYFGIRPQH